MLLLVMNITEKKGNEQKRKEKGRTNKEMMRTNGDRSTPRGGEAEWRPNGGFKGYFKEILRIF